MFVPNLLANPLAGFAKYPFDLKHARKPLHLSRLLQHYHVLYPIKIPLKFQKRRVNNREIQDFRSFAGVKNKSRSSLFATLDKTAFANGWNNARTKQFEFCIREIPPNKYSSIFAETHATSAAAVYELKLFIRYIQRWIWNMLRETSTHTHCTALWRGNIIIVYEWSSECLIRFSVGRDESIFSCAFCSWTRAPRFIYIHTFHIK